MVMDRRLIGETPESWHWLKRQLGKFKHQGHVIGNQRIQASEKIEENRNSFWGLGGVYDTAPPLRLLAASRAFFGSF
jgi:hypothetical protein